MQTTINGHNITVSESVREYALEKLEKLNRYLPNIADVRVDLTQQNSSRGPDMMIAQITLRHSRGAIIRAEEKIVINDYNAPKIALNAAVDKMYRRIRRFKGKRRSSRKRMHERYRISEEELALAEELPEAETAAEEEPESEIIRRKEVDITAMNEEEAIEQMELLGHTFFMYFDADANQINVVYKRGNGGYGLLKPKLA